MRRKRAYLTNQASIFRRMRRRAYYRQGGICYFCQQPFPLNDITGDHVVPRYAGGDLRPGNIVAACAGCNNTRQADETNRRGKNFVYVVGDDSPRSPFEVLRKLKA